MKPCNETAQNASKEHFLGVSGPQFEGLDQNPKFHDFHVWTRNPNFEMCRMGAHTHPKPFFWKFLNFSNKIECFSYLDHFRVTKTRWVLLTGKKSKCSGVVLFFNQNSDFGEIVAGRPEGISNFPVVCHSLHDCFSRFHRLQPSWVPWTGIANGSGSWGRFWWYFSLPTRPGSPKHVRPAQLVQTIIDLSRPYKISPIDPLQQLQQISWLFCVKETPSWVEIPYSRDCANSTPNQNVLGCLTSCDPSVFSSEVWRGAEWGFFSRRMG